MSDLTQEFYDTFGIEPKPEYWCKNFDKTGIANCNGILDAKNKCSKCKYGYIRNNFYPDIKAEKLLEMICICSSYVRELNYDYEINAKNIDNLKEEILQDCIDYAKESQKFKQQIQQLFKD